MRVAVVSEGYFPEISGVTIAVSRHLAFLRSIGHEVLLFHPRYPDEVLGALRRAGARGPEERSVQFDSKPLVPYRPEARVPSERGADELDQAIASFGPQVVVFH